jgi:hypothetical protein
MHQALTALASTVFASQYALAKWVGPNHSNFYGTAIVARCVRAGLIEFDATHPAYRAGKGVPVLTEAGRAYVASR